VPRSHRLSRQDGFIREILWVALAIAIVAVVLLDAMSIFNAHQTAREKATNAARNARTDYAQTLSLPSAKIAARQYLARSGLELVSFSAARDADDTRVFTVEAKAEADTYVFKFLGAIPGLDEWVDDMTHPTATGARE
jgi:heme exporter protein D